MVTESEECKAWIGDHLEWFAWKARSRAGERISNRSGARIVPEHRYSTETQAFRFRNHNANCDRSWWWWWLMMIHQIDYIGSSALRETRIRRALDCVKNFFLFKNLFTLWANRERILNRRNAPDYKWISSRLKRQHPTKIGREAASKLLKTTKGREEY